MSSRFDAPVRSDEVHLAWLLPAGTDGLRAFGWLLVAAAEKSIFGEFDGEFVLVGKPRGRQFEDFVVVGVKRRRLFHEPMQGATLARRAI